MTILWGNQFKELKGNYVFDPKRGKKPGSFRKIEKGDVKDDSIVLRYQIAYSGFNMRMFLLSLYDGKKLVEEKNGIISIEGSNEEYYDLINHMRLKAAETIEKKK